MMIVGSASLLPFSGYQYRNYPLNPVEIKEWFEAVKKGRERCRAEAVCLALVGLTLLMLYFAMFPY